VTQKSINPEASLDEAAPASYDDETAEAPTFDLDSWLGGATVMTASVDIVQNSGLLGRYAAWERKYEAAKEDGAVTGGDDSLGDESPLAALEREGAALRKQIEASTATWFVRALDSEERQAVIDAHPAPDEPPTFTDPAPRLVPSPTEAQANAYIKGMTAWEARRDAFARAHKQELADYQKQVRAIGMARVVESIARAVIRVEVGGRIIAESTEAGPAITAEKAAGLVQAIGEVQVAKLNAAINEAADAEPEVPAAFLPES